ncbi:MAG: ATP-binding cassette domain-containing protein [Nocardioidaceae bacterium]
MENAQCGGELSGSAREARRRAEEVLGSVGLGDRLHHYPSEFSGGEQQRVAIARALGTGNPIIVADEPTGDLDFRSGVQILELLEEQATAGRTVIVVTHNREISRVADRVIELSSGRIVSEGPPRGGRVPISELHWKRHGPAVHAPMGGPGTPAALAPGGGDRAGHLDRHWHLRGAGQHRDLAA